MHMYYSVRIWLPLTLSIVFSKYLENHASPKLFVPVDPEHFESIYFRLEIEALRITPPVRRKARKDKKLKRPYEKVSGHFLTLAAMIPRIPTRMVLMVSPRSP